MKTADSLVYLFTQNYTQTAQYSKQPLDGIYRWIRYYKADIR